MKEVGDFATHPLKDDASGKIIDVEVGEAEWNLFVIQELLAELYEKPARSKAMRKAFNRKSLAASRKTIGGDDDLPEPDERDSEGVAADGNHRAGKEEQAQNEPPSDEEYPDEDDLPF